MKKIFTILMTLCIISMFSFGQTNDLSVEYDTGIDDQKTVSTEVLPSTETTHNLNTGNNSSGNSIENPVDKNSLTKTIVKRGERPPIDIMAAPEDAYEKGILKIKFKESFTDQLDNNPVYMSDNGAVVFNISSVDQLNEQYRPTGFKKLFESGAFTGEYEDRHRAWGFHLWYTMYFDDKTDIKELVLAYGELDDVTISEPQYKTELHSQPMPFPSETDKGGSVTPPTDATSNDTFFGDQWHYHNTGQQGGTVDADIDLPEAWDLETGNSNVLVSIHDQGVQISHPDLNLNWSGLQYDFYDDDATVTPGYHGTHVAGTVAAETNNNSGVAGVAGGWNSEGVNYMTAQVYHPSGGGGVGHHLAPVWAADNGACIEQNSWGYTSAGYYDQSVLDAIDYFNTNGGGTALSGGITIYSAGNHGAEGLYYPGCYSGTFSVAATNNQDIRSYYSTYGTWVDISAPGGETHLVDERGIYSTYTTNMYDYLQGTSMACPHVSGTAGLIISMAYGLLTPTDVADILRNTADNHYGLNGGYIGKLGTGRLNAYQALLETQGYLVAPGTLMPLPAPTSSFTGNTRGYWFTAPTSFIVTGLRVPTDITGDQTIEIVRFNSGPPPTFSGTTNDFTSLGRWVSEPGSGFITCYIPVSIGDHIGILGCRGTTTSYGANNFVTFISGNAVTLTRLGMQYQLPTNVAQDLWQEPTGTSLGRIEMYYESVPGIWTGAVNHFWNQAGNWSDGTIPDAFTNVTIPAGTPNDCWVSTNDGFCNNITVESGSSLRIYDEILTVSGSMYMNGLLKMEEYGGIPGELHIAGSMYWGSGSTANITSNTLNMFIGVSWEFQSGANVQLTNGYVTFEGGFNSWIRSYDSDCYFNNIRNSKTSLYGLAVSELSTADLHINGNIYNYTSNVFRFRSDHSVIVGGFFNNLGGNFEGQFGTLVLDGTGVIGLKPNVGNYLNNLTISTSSVLSLDNSYSDLLTINGNLLIDAGGINANSFTIEVAGTWTNNVGTGGFVEGTSRVRFTKPDPGVQMINSTEHFNILELATDPTGGIRPAGSTDVSCNVFDWTSGGLSAVGATFTAFDLEDSGIYADIYAHPNSEITLYQDASQYVDLFSSVIWVKNNSSINIIGGADESFWCTSADLELLIEGSGVLDFDGYGITIHDSYLLTEDITDGTIKTSGWFSCNRPDFNPASGTFGFYGGTDSRISLLAGSTFHDLVINKSGGDKSSIQIKDRDGKPYTSSKANSAILYSDIVVANDVSITDGIFDSGVFDIYVGGDWTDTPGGFIANSGLVSFNGTGDVAINSAETFYNLTLEKAAGSDWLNPMGNLNILNDLTINEGTLYSGANSISVEGNATVNDGSLHMQNNSTLALGAGSQLVVNALGYFYVVGSAGNEALVTRNTTGTYSFTVFGTIGAQHAIFEYMNASGINVRDVGSVHPIFTFNNCTFKRGAPSPSALLVLNCDDVFTCENAYFENTFGNTQYNVWKYYDTGDVTFEAATGDFAGPEFEYDPNNRLHWSDMDVELDLSVMLEGAYSGGSMTTDLRDLGLIPLSQPFNSNPAAQWYYTGTESVGSIPPNVVDWVLVQIRDAADPASAVSITIVAEQAAFLLSDGRIVDLDGSSNIIFTGIDYSTGLYPVIMHRNHIGVISSDNVLRDGGVYTRNFTLAGSAYSNSNLGQKNLGGGDWGMYSGDASGGGVINDYDLSFWSGDAGLQDYLQGDHNLNSQADNIDKNDYWYVNLNIMTQVPLSKSDDN